MRNKKSRKTWRNIARAVDDDDVTVYSSGGWQCLHVCGRKVRHKIGAVAERRRTWYVHSITDASQDAPIRVQTVLGVRVFDSIATVFLASTIRYHWNRDDVRKDSIPLSTNSDK